VVIFLQQVRLALLGLITFLSIFNLYTDNLQIYIFEYYIYSPKYFNMMLGSLKRDTFYL
jgi:hypothetical protein